MKNKMQHVRDHLVAMMEALGDPDVSPEVIKRAKATATLAQTFTNTVKVEIDARRAAGIEDTLPDALLSPAPAPDRPRLIEGGRR